jgi:hypothetical protein
LNGVCFFLTTARQHDKIKIENITQGKMINPKLQNCVIVNDFALAYNNAVEK